MRKEGQRGGMEASCLPASTASTALHPGAEAGGVRDPKKCTLQATACAKCLLVAFGKVFMCCGKYQTFFYLKICCLLMPENFSFILCYNTEIPGLCTMSMAHPVPAYPVPSHPIPAFPLFVGTKSSSSLYENTLPRARRRSHLAAGSHPGDTRPLYSTRQRNITSETTLNRIAWKFLLLEVPKGKRGWRHQAHGGPSPGSPRWFGHLPWLFRDPSEHNGSAPTWLQAGTL